MQFSQFLAHDITLTPEGGILAFWVISNTKCYFTELECCNPSVLLNDLTAHPSIRRCFNIEVKHDPEFKGINDCFPFTRWSNQRNKSNSFVFFRSDIFCPKKGEPREQINEITAFIDGSAIYGSDKETSFGLRESVKVRDGDNGKTTTIPGARLKTQKDRRNNEALPSRDQCGFRSPQGTKNNPKPNPTPDDLTSGDTRAIVQPALTSMHTLFLHEHNRIVDALQQLWRSQNHTKDLPAHKREEFIF